LLWPNRDCQAVALAGRGADPAAPEAGDGFLEAAASVAVEGDVELDSAFPSDGACDVDSVAAGVECLSDAIFALLLLA